MLISNYRPIDAAVLCFAFIHTPDERLAFTSESIVHDLSHQIPLKTTLQAVL